MEKNWGPSRPRGRKETTSQDGEHTVLEAERECFSRRDMNQVANMAEMSSANVVKNGMAFYLYF